jgi:hypothetical protein
VLRDAITNVGRTGSHLEEEAAVDVGVPEHVGERAHELAHAALRHERSRAGLARPEAIARLIRLRAQNDRHVGGRGLGAEQPAELHPADPGQPEVADDRRRRLTKRELGALDRVRSGVDDVAVRAEARRKDIPRLLDGIDQNEAAG